MNIVMDRFNILRQNQNYQIPVEKNFTFTEVCLSMYFDSFTMIFRNNKKTKPISTITEVEEFLENKGPTYSIRTEPLLKTMEKFKGEYNQFLIRLRMYEKIKKNE